LFLFQARVYYLVAVTWVQPYGYDDPNSSPSRNGNLIFASPIVNIRLRVDDDGNRELLRAKHPLQASRMAVSKNIAHAVKADTTLRPTVSLPEASGFLKQSNH
jgi:hypothetical protein